VVQTYREMLESRQAVLDWLVHDQTSTPSVAHNVG
jgi:hypothetical protein